MISYCDHLVIKLRNISKILLFVSLLAAKENHFNAILKGLHLLPLSLNRCIAVHYRKVNITLQCVMANHNQKQKLKQD